MMECDNNLDGYLMFVSGAFASTTCDIVVEICEKVG